MNDRRCPVPACTDPVPADGIFCLEHYWCLPQKTTGFLFRFRALALRCEDADERKDMLDRLSGYIAEAVRELPDPLPTSSRAAASAGRQSSSLPAGTPPLKWPAGIVLRFGGGRAQGGQHG